MMSKFATIHGGLLARKGQAVPAIRHPGREDDYADAPEGEPSEPAAAAAEERTPPAAAIPVPAAPASANIVVAHRAEAPSRPRPCVVRSGSKPLAIGTGSDDGKPCKATVRLSARQRKLVKIATAVLGRSQQDIMSSALDAYLDHLGNNDLKSCGCYESHIGRAGRSRSEIQPA